MRILVTGSREWTDRVTLIQAILNAWSGHDQVVIVHGGHWAGADQIAAVAVRYYDLGEEVHPADWDKYGKQAGPIRNQEMVDAGADLCLAFLKEGAANRGTKDCIGRAEAAGIPVRRIEGGGGVREPSGDSPDSPPAGESRLPGGSDDYGAFEPTGNATFPRMSLSEPVPDYPVLVFGPGGTAHIEPLSEYYRKREVASPLQKFPIFPS